MSRQMNERMNELIGERVAASSLTGLLSMGETSAS